MRYRHYIVAGGGRTGSHWTEQIVRFITEYPTRYSLPDDHSHWIFHTHEIQDLVDIHKSIKDSSCLIFSKRRDIFSQTISSLVAKHIDEWFVYSNKEIEPFDIDQDEFLDFAYACQTWNQRFDSLVRPLYPHVIDLEFEDLVDHQYRVEDYLAQRIGIPNHNGSKSWDLNRNPRDYRKIVKNHAVLRALCPG